MIYPKLPQSNKLYIGIDQSVVCTSIAFLQNGDLKFHRVKSDVRGPELLNLLYAEVIKEVPPNAAGVAIEGYAYGAKGKYFNLGEIGGVIRLAITHKSNVPLIQVPPTTLKKFITGKGTSPKDIMIKELYKNYDLDINDNNDADAAGLAILAYQYYETRFHCVKAYEDDLHKACEIIIGEHPNKLSYKEYIKDMPDHYKLSDWQKEWIKLGK